MILKMIREIINAVKPSPTEEIQLLYSILELIQHPVLTKKKWKHIASLKPKSDYIDSMFTIKLNKFKNFVYPGTNLILDANKFVVATECATTGEWISLTEEDKIIASNNHLFIRSGGDRPTR